MIFFKHIFDFFSKTSAQIMMKLGSYMHLSKVAQVCSNQCCMMYFHRIMQMSFWIVTERIFTMYYYMSLCTFPFLTLQPLHGLASNLVWMFFGWTPTRFVKIRVLPLFFIELWVILCNFGPIL